jgi:hypothetical protein
MDQNGWYILSKPPIKNNLRQSNVASWEIPSLEVLVGQSSDKWRIFQQTMDLEGIS